MTVLDRSAPPVERLAGQKLPAYALPALGVAVLAVTALLWARTGFTGRADFVVFAVALHLVAQSALSFAVEGRRQAVDPLFTTLVHLLVGINQKIEFNPFAGTGDPNPQAALPTYIFEQFGVAAGNTDAPAFQRAWGAALVLIIIIGLPSLIARLIARVARVRG